MPGLQKPYCVRVRHFEQEGHETEADKALKEALRLGPNSWEVNREAARLMFRRDRMGDAIRYFEKAVAADGHRFPQLPDAPDLLSW